MQIVLTVLVIAQKLRRKGVEWFSSDSEHPPRQIAM